MIKQIKETSDVDSCTKKHMSALARKQLHKHVVLMAYPKSQENIKNNDFAEIPYS
jgi:hypothetical protein